MKIKKVCKECKKEFYTIPSKIKNGGGKFCSKKCFNKWNRAENNPNWKEKIERICKTCGNKFFVRPSQLKNGGGKYCSRLCMQTRNGEKIKGICKICGKEFFSLPGQTKQRKKKFCSKRCYGKWQSENMKGENNHSWQGGITPYTKKIRNSIEFRLWREAVFARDNWTCQKCEERCGNGKAIYLEAHHIKGFTNYPELRFAIDNGLTLCRECHQLTKQNI